MQLNLVFDDKIIVIAAWMMRDPAAPIRTTLLNDAGGALGPMRLCARRSRHSFSQRHFRIQRMLSQDEVRHNSQMLRSSKPSVSRDKRNWSVFLARSGYCQRLSNERSVQSKHCSSQQIL